MKTHKQFATVTQHQAWQAECQREATKRMLRRLMKQLSRLAQEPVPVGERRLAQEYRLLRAQHAAKRSASASSAGTKKSSSVCKPRPTNSNWNSVVAMSDIVTYRSRCWTTLTVIAMSVSSSATARSCG